MPTPRTCDIRPAGRPASFDSSRSTSTTSRLQMRPWAMCLSTHSRPQRRHPRHRPHPPHRPRLPVAPQAKPAEGSDPDREPDDEEGDEGESYEGESCEGESDEEEAVEAAAESEYSWARVGQAFVDHVGPYVGPMLASSPGLAKLLGAHGRMPKTHATRPG